MSFAPKKSTRLSPNISFPLKLTNKSLNVVTKMLTQTADKRAMIRNSKEKKAIRDYLSTNLTTLLRQDILQRAHELRGPQSVLNLLDLFDPRQDAKEIADLVGPSSLRYGCSRSGRHKWFIRPLEQYNLTLPQLEQLYNILIWSNPSELRMLALSASSDVLKASKIPSILARGRALTKVTLLEGADNHILRILGINCPRLKYLDISNSTNVTDQGLYNLLLHRPPKRKEKILTFVRVQTTFEVVIPITAPQNYGDFGSRKKNPCAETIAFIKFPCTSITPQGCGMGCALMSNSYVFVPLPFITILRVVEPKGIWRKGIPYDRTLRLFTRWEGLPIKVISSISLLVRETIEDGVEQGDLQPLTLLDYIVIPKQKPTEEQRSMLFILRSRKYSFDIHMKVHAQNVTSLVLNCPYHVDLIILQVLFPCLKSFRGWILGLGFPGDEPFLPNLEVLSAWCLSKEPILAILRLAPSIKLLEINKYSIHNRNRPNDIWLTEATLEACLRTNKRLAESLEEIIFSPCKLTGASVRALISICPNLKIIGDLQSWKITSRQIKSLNNYLNKVNSKCVLSVMNFPPSRIQNFQWI